MENKLTIELKEKLEVIVKPIFPVQSSDNIDAISWSSLHDIDKEQLIIAMFEAYLLDRDKWISVEDESPMSGEIIEVCQFDVPNKVFNFKYNNEFKNWCFTHWRYASPLPKKPNQ